MYIETEHHLESPICSCFYKKEFSHYVWSTYNDQDNRRGLRISCQICKAFLSIPSDHYKACVTVHNYDKERKGFSQAKAKQNKKDDKPNLKVLEFPKPKEEEPLLKTTD